MDCHREYRVRNSCDGHELHHSRYTAKFFSRAIRPVSVDICYTWREMSTLQPFIEAWDEAHRELVIALDAMPDDDLWVRPHPRLLSVGELAGHIAYWQAIWTLGGGNPKPNLNELSLQSPLVLDRFRYFTSSVDRAIQLDMGAATLLAEVERIHDIAKEYLRGKEFGDPYPGQWGTWGYFVQYQVFHVAYHTGQIYSVRHLLGHETLDN